MSKLKISRNNIGISGEFYIAHVLAKHDFKVNVSLRRTEGFDLFVQNSSGVNLVVSVKTTYLKVNQFVLINKNAETLIGEKISF